MIELDLTDQLKRYAASEVDTYELKNSVLQDNYELREKLIYSLDIADLISDQAISKKLLEDNNTKIETNLIEEIENAILFYSENKEMYDE